jgi:hypothetical protein
MIRAKILTLGLSAVALASLGSPALAQSSASALSQSMAVSSSWLLGGAGSNGSGTALGDLFRGSPGTTGGSPMAFGAAMGDVFVGSYFEGRSRALKAANGTFTKQGHWATLTSVGFGLGDGSDIIGLTTVLTNHSNFYDNGFSNFLAVSLQAYHNFDETLTIAGGAENLIVSGGGSFDGHGSWYGVASKIFKEPMSGLKAITLSGGIGTGRFRTVGRVRDDDGMLGVFGQANALLHEQASFTADWTGQDLNLGLSIVPFKDCALTITPGVADLLSIANSMPRWVINVGWGVHF